MTYICCKWYVCRQIEKKVLFSWSIVLKNTAVFLLFKQGFIMRGSASRLNYVTIFFCVILTLYVPNKIVVHFLYITKYVALASSDGLGIL